MKYTINVILRYKIGILGFGHDIKAAAKLHPIKKHGIVNLELKPINPLKQVNTINILKPNKFYVQLPNDQTTIYQITSVVMSENTNGDVNRR